MGSTFDGHSYSRYLELSVIRQVAFLIDQSAGRSRISVNVFLGDHVQDGDVIYKYLKPEHAANTGLHRYIFLVYKQLEVIPFEGPCLSDKTTIGRGKHSVRQFACQYKLGQPHAGNFFLQQSKVPV